MYAACVLISPAMRRAMYVDDLRSTDDIAAHFGCSGTTVRRHLAGSKSRFVREVRASNGSGLETIAHNARGLPRSLPRRQDTDQTARSRLRTTLSPRVLVRPLTV